MSGVQIISPGGFPKTIDFLKSLNSENIFSDLDSWGRIGFSALEAATPVDSGLAAGSWGYNLIQDNYGPGIEWYNSDVEGGDNVIILIQYGHGTGTGGYVAPRDFINPVMQPIFDAMQDEVFKKLTGP